MRTATLLLAASSALALAAPAMAADAAPSGAFGLGEIVVTASQVQGVEVDAATCPIRRSRLSPRHAWTTRST